MMKRIFSLLAVLMLCAAVFSPIAASADTFVPSISYKDGPQIEDAEMEDEDVAPCLIVTSILAAEEKTTDIEQEERDLLLEVYEALKDGSMELPLEEDYVIRELVDVDFRESACIIPDHTHEEDLQEEGITVTIDFDLGVSADTEVVVLVYIDGAWIPVKSVVNNGDGTVTCVFEQLCPVAFCVRETAGGGPAQTGDSQGDMLILWGALLLASVAGLIVLLVLMRRKK